MYIRPPPTRHLLLSGWDEVHGPRSRDSFSNEDWAFLPIVGGLIAGKLGERKRPHYDHTSTSDVVILPFLI